MRRYSEADEERIRLQQQVKDWMRSGLLAPEQGAQLQSDLRVDLRRTGLMLRLGLALFSVISVAALIALIFITLNIREEVGVSLLAMGLGLGCFWLADLMVARFRLYRYGVEEALLAVSVVLWGIAVAIMVNSAVHRNGEAFAAALVAGATVSTAAYLRFGLQYASVAAVVFAALTPLPFDRFGDPARSIVIALLFAIALAVASRIRNRTSLESRRDDASLVAAAALIGMYLALNIHATPELFGRYSRTDVPWFKWTTYVLTWIIPPSGLWRAIANRDRKLMVAALAIAMVTLITNKPYLELPRQTWDPMVFGLLLMVVAVGLRRWLAAGPGGERSGFTSVRILRSDNDRLNVASLASAAVHLGTARPEPALQEPSQFGGGRSGGGGAGADF